MLCPLRILKVDNKTFPKYDHRGFRLYMHTLFLHVGIILVVFKMLFYLM